MINAEAVINEAAHLIIPFTFNKEVFEKSAIEWVSQGEYTPADILDSLHNNAARGVYIPVYLWQISYIITSPAGNKTGGTMAVNLAEGQKPWPGLLELANSIVTSKGHLKPFDKVYTLGFEIIEDEIADVEDFNSKARKFAKETVVAKNNLPDEKNVIINEMSLTKVYVSFWINKYNYQGQSYEVIMSGSDAGKIDGARPVDQKAATATKPTYKMASAIFGISSILTILCILASPKAPSGVSTIIDVFATIGILVMTLVAPVLFVIAFFRRSTWTNPAIKLKKERDQKLTQRLAQKL